jgi:YHS domain-containing protein
MLEFALDVIFTLVAIRAIWKLLQGVMQGLSERTGQQRRAGRAPVQGVQMAKDPVCGTYVVPDRALSESVGHERVYFCSAECRDKYRAKTA